MGGSFIDKMTWPTSPLSYRNNGGKPATSMLPHNDENESSLSSVDTNELLASPRDEKNNEMSNPSSIYSDTLNIPNRGITFDSDEETPALPITANVQTKNSKHYIKKRIYNTSSNPTNIRNDKRKPMKLNMSKSN